MAKNISPGSYHKTDLKRTLLEALRDELREHGPGDVSLRRVAERAGVSHAAPYRHFNGKDGLLAAFCWEGQAEFTARLAAAREGAPHSSADPVDRLFRLGFAYLDFARRKPEAFRLMFSAAGIRAMGANPPQDFATAPGRYDSFGVLLATVGECQAAGALDPREESVTLGLLIWSFVHGLAFIRGEGLGNAPDKASGVKPADMEPAVMKAFKAMILCKEASHKKKGK
jgi:AcrR family transcriptional regulator